MAAFISPFCSTFVSSFQVGFALSSVYPWLHSPFCFNFSHFPADSSAMRAGYPVTGKTQTGEVDIFIGSVYSSDEFRMYEYKIKRCPITKSHDWTRCPYAHRGEKAQRRDPRKFNYSAISCLDYRNGKCDKGESCELAHGVFEYWLHPAKYRTRPCNSGKYCDRKVCFFAHSPEELRSETKYRCRFVYPPTGEGKYEEAEIISTSSSLPGSSHGFKEKYLTRLDHLRMRERDSGFEETEIENINNWIHELLM